MYRWLTKDSSSRGLPLFQCLLMFKPLQNKWTQNPHTKASPGYKEQESIFIQKRGNVFNPVIFCIKPLLLMVYNSKIELFSLVCWSEGSTVHRTVLQYMNEYLAGFSVINFMFNFFCIFTMNFNILQSFTIQYTKLQHIKFTIHIWDTF